jgi:uncharacterized alkaline shock family protein YloU
MGAAQETNKSPHTYAPTTTKLPAKDGHKDDEAEARGQTFVEDEVVSIIARTAAQQVQGVHRLGESSLRTLFSRFGRSHGVDAEVGMKEAAIDVEVVVEFGYPIRDVANEIRHRVIEIVEEMVGRTVLEVNVYVIDIHTPAVEGRRRRTLE